jgi:hypothetical protein
MKVQGKIFSRKELVQRHFLFFHGEEVILWPGLARPPSNHP